MSSTPLTTIPDTAPVVIVIAGRRYPPQLTTAEAAAWLQTDSGRMSDKVGTGRLPFEPLRWGHQYRWRTIDIARLLGLDYEVVHADEPAA